VPLSRAEEENVGATLPRYCGNHHHLLPATATTTAAATAAAPIASSHIAADEPKLTANGRSNGGKDNDDSGRKRKRTGRKRVPCPVDPSHSVYEDCVARHEPVCPKTKRLKAQQLEWFFQQGINRGGHGDGVDDGANVKRVNGGANDDDNDDDEDQLLEWAKRVAVRALHVYKQLFPVVDTNGNNTEEPEAPGIVFQDLSRPELEAGIETAVKEYSIRAGGNHHLHQQASLIGHLRRIGAFDDGDADRRSSSGARTIVEVGAGRGMLGLIAAGVSSSPSSFSGSQSTAASSKTNLVLVERGASRSKADTVLRKASLLTESASAISRSYLNFENINWKRIKGDLAHVDMKTVLSSLQDGEKSEKNSTDDDTKRAKIGKVVVIAKHLCGVGTDFALKSLEPVKKDIDAVVMATCCHGVCSWDDYVGRYYLRNAMMTMKKDESGGSADDNNNDGYDDCSFSFGRDEFELIRRWSVGALLGETGDKVGGSVGDSECEHQYQPSGSCCATTSSIPSVKVTTVAQALGLDCGARGLGQCCKRLIDYGRREYLQHVIFPKSARKVELMAYVPSDVTPENAVLIASQN